MTRDTVRELLQYSFEEDNAQLDVSDLFDGMDPDFDFTHNRDIYAGLASEGDSVFLSYDKDGQFKEFEMPEGIAILIDDFRLYQDQPISEIIAWMQSKGYAVTEDEPGNYAVSELKIAIATHNAMGGDGDGLSYFYAANDISHLID